MKKCPLIDYQKDYKAIAKNALAIVGITTLIVLFLGLCVVLA